MPVDTLTFIATNGAVALAAAAVIYARNYVNLAQDELEGSTRPVSDEVSGYTGTLARYLTPEFEKIREKQSIGSRHKGELDPLKMIEAEIRRRSGHPPDEKGIFVTSEEEDVRIQVGLLFSNTVTARDIHKGYPLELTVQSFYESLNHMPKIELGIFAYDKDFHVIREFDYSYDCTPDGLIPKRAGHHNRLDFALERLPEHFGGTNHKLLYIVTPPIKSRNQMRKVEQGLATLRSRQIVSGFVFLTSGDRLSQAPYNTPSVAVNCSASDLVFELRKKIKLLNEPMNEALWEG